MDLVQHQSTDVGTAVSPTPIDKETVQSTYKRRTTLRTPTNLVKKHPYHKWDYVTAHTALNLLSEAGFEVLELHSHLDQAKEFAGVVSVPVTLRVLDMELGVEKRITEVGSDEAIYKKGSDELKSGQYHKAAVSDGIKRCVVRLGLLRDVYSDKEDFDATVAQSSSGGLSEDEIALIVGATGISEMHLKIIQGIFTKPHYKDRFLLKLTEEQS